MFFSIDKTLLSTYHQIASQVEMYGPKLVGALLIFLIGVLIARGCYIFALFLFKKIKLNEIIDNLSIEEDKTKSAEKDSDKNKEEKTNLKELKTETITSKVKIDNVVAKSISYYIAILFFRMAISYIGITDIEDFLKDLTDYLPNLFIGVTIGFFGIRFANFIYGVVYHTLNLTKDKTSKIVATGAKIIILFFTLMLFLDYTQVVSSFIINTIIIGFISMFSLGAGLAFGLGGKEIAREILESFRK